MKNTKKYRKVNKTTKRNKNGERKNSISNLVIQTAGYNSLFNDNQSGGSTPNPRPASGLNIYELDTKSLRDSMQSYGDAIQSIVETAQTGVDIYQLPSGAPVNFNDNTPSYNEILVQFKQASELKTAADLLLTRFSSNTAGNIGLYQTIYGPNAVFTATPGPSPSPARLSGGVATTPSAGAVPPVSGISQTLLKNKLDQFGNAIFNLYDISEYYNSLFRTTAPLTEPSVPVGSTTTFTAFSAFISQKIAADSLLEAIKSTYDAFTGTADYSRANRTGSIGLYRAILGDNIVYIPPALPPGTEIVNRAPAALS